MDRKSEISANIERVEAEIARALELSGRSRSEITLIAVTKNFPITDIEILYQLGIREFGENRDQEAREKVQALAERLGAAHPEVRWHFQGQLQRNKLASISSWADMVHSVDHPKYLKGLSEGAVRRGGSIQLLIQLSLDENPAPARGGTDIAGAREILSLYTREKSEFPGITLAGVMGVAPLDIDPARAFARLAKNYSELRAEYPSLQILSAGMSGDFFEAIVAGATHLRIGSSILGSRL